MIIFKSVPELTDRRPEYFQFQSHFEEAAQVLKDLLAVGRIHSIHNIRGSCPSLNFRTLDWTMIDIESEVSDNQRAVATSNPIKVFFQRNNWTQRVEVVVPPEINDFLKVLQWLNEEGELGSFENSN